MFCFQTGSSKRERSGSANRWASRVKGARADRARCRRVAQPFGRGGGTATLRGGRRRAVFTRGRKSRESPKKRYCGEIRFLIPPLKKGKLLTGRRGGQRRLKRRVFSHITRFAQQYGHSGGRAVVRAQNRDALLFPEQERAKPASKVHFFRLTRGNTGDAGAKGKRTHSGWMPCSRQ
jgi:hypothetical protein